MYKARLTTSRIRIYVFITKLNLLEIRIEAVSLFTPNPLTIFYRVSEKIKEPC